MDDLNIIAYVGPNKVMLEIDGEHIMNYNHLTRNQVKRFYQATERIHREYPEAINWDRFQSEVSLWRKMIKMVRRKVNLCRQKIVPKVQHQL
ncbi:MAG TPA: hypothetical protein VFX18_00465 [Candidatus Nitrosocosmicus sp.]|nr:hypothetical protein [Candidatus Nitrosocosmicus sp.]